MVGGWVNDVVESRPPVQAAQTVTVMCGTALSPQIRAASRNVPYFFRLTRPFRPQLPRLCHITSHAHGPAVRKVLLWP